MANLVQGEWDIGSQGGIVAAERKRKLAEALRKQATNPQGQMVGGIYVAPSITQYLASGLKEYQAGRLEREGNQQEQDIYRQRGETIKEANRRLADALKPKQVPDGYETLIPDRKMDQFGSPVQGQDMTPQQGAPRYKTVQPSVDDRFSAQAEYAQTLGDPNLMMSAMNNQTNYQVSQQDKDEQRKFLAEQKAMEIQARMDSLKEQIAARAQQGQESRDLQERLAMMQIEGRKELQAIMTANRPPQAPVAIIGPNGQPMYVSPEQAYGKTPAKGVGKGMSAAAQKELFDAEDSINGSRQAIKAFEQALQINDKAMGGFGAGALATAGSVLPDMVRPGVIDSTKELDNILQGSALPQLKAIFGGMPTEGERAILLEVQGSSSQPAKVRKGIFERAKAAAEDRIKYNQKKAQQIRNGEFFSDDGGIGSVPSAPATQPAAIKKYNPATGKIE